MANVEIVFAAKHGNVFIGGQQLKINLTYNAEYSDETTEGKAVLGKATLGNAILAKID